MLLRLRNSLRIPVIPLSKYAHYTVGQNLAACTEVKLRDIDGAERSLADVFANKKVVVVGVPAAFSPICHGNHVPPFVSRAKELKNEGVDDVVCVSVNDHFVMNAWSEDLNAGAGGLRLLADPSGNFARLLGLDIDLSASGAGLGVRSRRYSLVVNNGRVDFENVEKELTDVEASSVDVVASQINVDVLEAYNSQLAAMAAKADVAGVLRLFRSLRYIGLQPNVDSYASVFQVLAHEGDYEAIDAHWEMLERQGLSEDSRAVEAYKHWRSQARS